MKRKLRYIAWMCCLFILQACSTFHGIKPVYPDAGHPAYHIVEVDSLQPILEWAASDGAETTYDLRVMEGPPLEGKIYLESWKNPELTIVYQKEKIPGSRHKIDVPLKPAHLYFWSVKESGTKVDWSYYNYHLFAGIFYYYWPKQLYRFKTPN